MTGDHASEVPGSRPVTRAPRWLSLTTWGLLAVSLVWFAAGLVESVARSEAREEGPVGCSFPVPTVSDSTLERAAADAEAAYSAWSDVALSDDYEVRAAAEARAIEAFSRLLAAADDYQAEFERAYGLNAGSLNADDPALAHISAYRERYLEFVHDLSRGGNLPRYEPPPHSEQPDPTER